MKVFNVLVLGVLIFGLNGLANARVINCATLSDLEGVYNVASTIAAPDGNTFFPIANSSNVLTRVRLVPFERNRNGISEKVKGLYKMNLNHIDENFPFPAVAALTENDWACKWTVITGQGLMIPNFPSNLGQIVKGPEIEELVFLEKTNNGFIVGGQLHRVKWTKISDL